MTAPTAAEWQEAAVPAVLKFMARCYDAGYKDALDAEPEARRWNALLKEGEGDNEILAALRPLIERLERALDASTVRLRAALPKPKEEVADGWLPTPENINALPEPLRAYVATLETRSDPSGEVRENIIARETAVALEAEIAALRALLAAVEGLLITDDGQDLSDIDGCTPDDAYSLGYKDGKRVLSRRLRAAITQPKEDPAP